MPLFLPNHGSLACYQANNTGANAELYYKSSSKARAFEGNYYAWHSGAGAGHQTKLLNLPYEVRYALSHLIPATSASPGLFDFQDQELLVHVGEAFMTAKSGVALAQSSSGPFSSTSTGAVSHDSASFLGAHGNTPLPTHGNRTTTNANKNLADALAIAEAAAFLIGGRHSRYPNMTVYSVRGHATNVLGLALRWQNHIDLAPLGPVTHNGATTWSRIVLCPAG